MFSKYRVGVIPKRFKSTKASVWMTCGTERASSRSRKASSTTARGSAASALPRPCYCSGLDNFLKSLADWPPIHRLLVQCGADAAVRNKARTTFPTLSHHDLFFLISAPPAAVRPPVQLLVLLPLFPGCLSHGIH
jgi:hypothetical protein